MDTGYTLRERTLMMLGDFVPKVFGKPMVLQAEIPVPSQVLVWDLDLGPIPVQLVYRMGEGVPLPWTATYYMNLTRDRIFDKQSEAVKWLEEEIFGASRSLNIQVKNYVGVWTSTDVTPTPPPAPYIKYIEMWGPEGHMRLLQWGSPFGGPQIWYAGVDEENHVDDFQQLRKQESLIPIAGSKKYVSKLTYTMWRFVLPPVDYNSYDLQSCNAPVENVIYSEAMAKYEGVKCE